MSQVARLNDGPSCTCCAARRRGVVYVDTPAGPYGIAICPVCDWAHDHAAGPPPSLEHRARDFPEGAA